MMGFSAVTKVTERGGIRISFGMFNTAEDVDQTVSLIQQRLSRTTHSTAAAQVD
jgi:cysteine desulfurase/selenocysteine lyase